MSKTVKCLYGLIYIAQKDKLYKYLLKNKVESRLFWHPINYCKPYKQTFRNLEISKMYNERLLWLPSTLDLTKNLKKYVA